MSNGGYVEFAIKGENIAIVNSLKFPGSRIDRNSDCNEEVCRRIVIGRIA